MVVMGGYKWLLEEVIIFRDTQTNTPALHHNIWWILIFPTSRLPPRWAICRWAILISRYINIAHLGYNTIFEHVWRHHTFITVQTQSLIVFFHFWDHLSLLCKCILAFESSADVWSWTWLIYWSGHLLELFSSTAATFFHCWTNNIPTCGAHIGSRVCPFHPPFS